MPVSNFPLTQVSYAEQFSPGPSPTHTIWSGVDGGDCTGVCTMDYNHATPAIQNIGVYITFSVDLSAIPSFLVVSKAIVMVATHTKTGDLSHVTTRYALEILDPNGTYSAAYTNGDFLELAYTPYQGLTIGSGTITITDIHIAVTWELQVSPNIGGSAGGDTVDVFGFDFDGTTGVEFDGVPATDVTIIDPSHLTCVIPAHAVGLVDVETTGSGAATLTDGFTYSSLTSTPIINDGATEQVFGPAPATKTTTATVTRGANNGVLTYLWTQVDGPASATILSPTTLETDIEFGAYVPGVYSFQLEVTTSGDPIIVASDIAQVFFIADSVAPRATNGSLQVFYADGATLNPTITDDGWGGTLSYAWEQLAGGPDTASIVSPTAEDTDVDFPATQGVYLFRITVSRSDDALVGSGTWRVAVFTDEAEVEDLELGPVSLTINGDDVLDAQINSTRISKSLGSNPSCSFRLYGYDIDRFNDVVVTRGSKRLFAGICLSSTLNVDEKVAFRQVNLVGYSWHLHRRPFSQTYLNQSISAVVAAILTEANVGITGEFIAPGLETISVQFLNEFPDDALDIIANTIHAHWYVDDLKRLHFAVLEAQGDPLAISEQHPWYRDLVISRDVRNQVNRVIVKYTAVSTVSVDVDPEIEVDSLEDYSYSGGDTEINGSTIHYTGLATRILTSVYGTVQLSWTQTGIDAGGGEFIPGDLVSYSLTIETSLGETPVVSGASAQVVPGGANAFLVRLTNILGAPDTVRRITAINIYRKSNFDGAQTFYVGTISPKGGFFEDKYTLATLGTFPVEPPVVNTADEVANFLTGCTGLRSSDVESTVERNDTGAQAAVAAAFGGSDDGVLAIVLSGGKLLKEAAEALATAYLEAAKAEATEVSVEVRDDDALPGQTLSVFLPDPPYECTVSLKIQSSELSGFELGVPHTYRVSAARDRVTMQDILKHSTNLIKPTK